MYPTVPYRRCEHPERPAPAVGPLRHTRTVRVLVVEDDGELAEAIAAGLRLEGMAVDASGNQCPSYTDLAVSPPDIVQVVNVAASIDACVLQVHPVTAGQ